MGDKLQAKQSAVACPGSRQRSPAQGRLRDSAILSLDGALLLRQRRWSRELALEFLDGIEEPSRPTLAWLVTPEAMWPEADKASNVGLGLSPSQVARELALATSGLRIYAAEHPIVSRWLRHLFAAAHLGKPPFVVRDVFSLFLSITRDEADVRAASAAANTIEVSTRAAAEAGRHARFARSLASLADTGRD